LRIASALQIDLTELYKDVLVSTHHNSYAFSGLG